MSSRKYERGWPIPRGHLFDDDSPRRADGIHDGRDVHDVVNHLRRVRRDRRERS
jgi:hypothetical protein